MSGVLFVFLIERWLVQTAPLFSFGHTSWVLNVATSPSPLGRNLLRDVEPSLTGFSVFL